MLDQYIVLCWITNDKLWNSYVQRRVQEIRQLTPKGTWGFCPGSQNPADLPCRGMEASNLVSSSTWWNGPEYLQKSQWEWPNDPTASSLDETALKETIKKPATVIHSLVSTKVESSEVNLNGIIDCDNFSSVTRLFHVMAYLLRFVKKLKVKRSASNTFRVRSRQLTKSRHRNSMLQTRLFYRHSKNVFVDIPRVFAGIRTLVVNGCAPLECFLVDCQW